MHSKVLLEILADGQFHSGDDLGVALGVTRTAIWKQIKKIQDMGLPVESVKGRGYCIVGGLDLLSAQIIGNGLSTKARALICELDVQDVVESTNALAMVKAQQKNSGYVCTAEQQLVGRGRRGRQWSSPYATGVSLSIVWEFGNGVAALEGLSLAIGVVVVQALESVGIKGVNLKWPNDVLYQGKKLAGVLLEIVGDAQGPCRVIVGIGLNVAIDKQQMLQVTQPWTDIASIVQSPISRNQLLICLLNELMPMLERYNVDSFSAYRERWMGLDAYAGRNIKIHIGNNTHSGKSIGVDQAGAIIIEHGDSKKTYSGGEVSLRPE